MTTQGYSVVIVDPLAFPSVVGTYDNKETAQLALKNSVKVFKDYQEKINEPITVCKETDDKFVATTIGTGMPHSYTIIIVPNDIHTTTRTIHKNILKKI